MPASILPPATAPQIDDSTIGSPKPRVLAIGPWEEPSFVNVRATLEDTAIWHNAESINAAREKLVDLPTTDLLLLAQPRSNYYRQGELDVLLSESPLLRTVVVAGSWCEGELRTGPPLQGVLRLYWYEVTRWWQAALERLASGEAPPWSEPLDGTTPGRWVPTDKLPRAAGGTVVIDTPDVAVFETLKDVLAAHGLSAVWYRGESFEAAPNALVGAIWDGGQLGDAELQQLAAFCDAMAVAKVTVNVLLDFPRVEHLRQARAVGAVAVLAKPYGVAELMGVLR